MMHMVYLLVTQPSLVIMMNVYVNLKNTDLGGMECYTASKMEENEGLIFFHIWKLLMKCVIFFQIWIKKTHFLSKINNNYPILDGYGHPILEGYF